VARETVEGVETEPGSSYAVVISLAPEGVTPDAAEHNSLFLVTGPI
jgi:hypothetical protein